MDNTTMVLLERITRQAFLAGHARGQYDAIRMVMPEAVETFMKMQPDAEMPMTVDAYLDYVKAGVIMKTNGLK